MNRSTQAGDLREGALFESRACQKKPDIGTALSFQKEISEARGQFEQKMIKHLTQMKMINLEAERK